MYFNYFFFKLRHIALASCPSKKRWRKLQLQNDFMFFGIPGGKLSEHKKDLRDLTMQGRQRDDSGSKYNELKIIEERA